MPAKFGISKLPQPNFGNSRLCRSKQCLRERCDGIKVNRNRWGQRKVDRDNRDGEKINATGTNEESLTAIGEKSLEKNLSSSKV